MKILAFPAVLAALALSVLVAPMASAEPMKASEVDVCSVLSEQAAGKLRTLAGPVLPDAAKDLPNSLLVAAARVKAGCKGDAPKLSEAELTERLCALATREGVNKLAATVGASEERKSKVTQAHLDEARKRLGCDSARPTPSPTPSPSPTKPTPTPSPTKPSPTSTSALPTYKLPPLPPRGGSYSQVGEYEVPYGSIATGG